MQNQTETTLMVLVARLYYEQDLNQNEIAKRLKLTRQKVSRLLIQARTTGVVRITICDPVLSDPELSIRLKETFGLHEVILTRGEDLDTDTLRKRIGVAAAEYLTQVLKDETRVGIGRGRSLYEVVSAFPKKQQVAINVTPLMGGIGEMAPFFQNNELARQLAESFGGKYRALYLPAFVQDQETLSALMNTLELTQVAEAWKQISLAIVGIGNIEFQQMSSMYFANYISQEAIDRLVEYGAVGDICGRFFDINGNPVQVETGIIGIDLQRMRSIPETIGIAGGKEKAQAIIGALRGGYIKTLVTDTVTAQTILAEA